MSTPPLYRIRDWAEHYDSGEAKKLKKLTWVQMPNSHDGLGMSRLSRRDDGMALFGAWCLIVQVSSQNPVRSRGLLINNGKPLTAEDLFLKTRFCEETFAAALEYFSDPKVGWLEIVNPEEMNKIPEAPEKHTPRRKESPEVPGDSPEIPGDSPDTSGKSPATPPDVSGKSPATGQTDRTGQDMTRQDNPLNPHDAGAASPQGGGVPSAENSGSDAEAIRFHRDYARREAKGLKVEFLNNPDFRDTWCDWLAHLKGLNHGRNPSFSTIDAHKRQLNAHSTEDAIWALAEAIRRGFRAPLDPAKRSPFDREGGATPGDAYASRPATPEEAEDLAADFVANLAPVPRLAPQPLPDPSPPTSGPENREKNSGTTPVNIAPPTASN